MFRKLFACLVLTAFSGAAFSASCPVFMGEIDSALEDPAVEQRLSSEQLAEVRQLREQGEKAHRAGDHAKSMEVLGRAKRVLEI